MATRRTSRGTLLAAIVLCVASSAAAESFPGEVVGVIDGDTIDVMREGKADRVRLVGIDCPERKQAFGSRAKERTSELAARKVVTVEVQGHDRYGRTLGEVRLPDGSSLNKALVRDGMAWWYRKYSSDQKLAELEAAARRERRGLWVDKEPVPPWEFRKAKPWSRGLL